MYGGWVKFFPSFLLVIGYLMGSLWASNERMGMDVQQKIFCDKKYLPKIKKRKIRKF